MQKTSLRPPIARFDERASDLVAVGVATQLRAKAVSRHDRAMWTLELIESSMVAAYASDDIARALAECAQAVLANATGRYEIGLPLAERASNRADVGQRAWALAELVEAGMRTGDVALASDALSRLSHEAAGGDERIAALLARSRALLTSGTDAESLYREAITGFAGAGLQLQRARAELLYGEWLRREGRRVDARVQLRCALDRFEELEAGDFRDRARRELSATCETVRRNAFARNEALTSQEAEIARLAREGHTNSEIGVMLFLSPRTVEWHLGKVFAKLGITSRRGLWSRPAPAISPFATRPAER
jgi:DNA-binding CsgD family transcriptional regulator